MRKSLFVLAGVLGLLVLTGCASATPTAGAVHTSASVAKVSVPNLEGMTRTDARKVVQNRGLSAVDETVPATPDAVVIAQDPVAGSNVPKGSVVSLTFDAVQSPTPTPEVSALMQQIRQKFPGYPLVVPTSSVDYRVANWARSTPQLVALAPGVYTAYNPAVTDLSFYVDEGDTAEGDCTLIKALFTDRGGACWDGVAAGSAEPQ